MLYLFRGLPWLVEQKEQAMQTFLSRQQAESRMARSRRLYRLAMGQGALRN